MNKFFTSNINRKLNNSNRLLRKIDGKIGNIGLGNESLGNEPVGSENDYYFDLYKEVEESPNVEELQSKLAHHRNKVQSLYNKADQYMIMDSSERRRLNIFKEAQLLEKIFRDKVINYVAAILDPEYNYNTGIMVKQPSLMNPPSVSIPIKTLTTIKSESLSSICISWNPTLFCTKNDVQKIILGQRDGEDVYANRIASVLYSLPEKIGAQEVVQADSWNAKVRAIPDNLPEIGVSKARLVSAKIKISFRGSVLNQGGTIMGAATFQGAPGLVLNTDEENYVYRNHECGAVATWADLFKVTLGDQFSDKGLCPFQEKVLSNGIWAKNVNITKDANGITAIFIPTDPMDEIFYKPGTFYGEKVAQDENIINKRGATTALNSNKGARLNYLFNIQGLSAQNTNPITIETYQTWEVLPTNQSASSLRNSASEMNSLQSYEMIKDLLSNYLSESSGIHTLKQNNLGGFFDKLKDIAQRTWKGIKAAME
jgi:hypothetical protein